MNDISSSQNGTTAGNPGELRWIPVLAGAFAVMVALAVTLLLTNAGDEEMAARAELFSGLGGDFTLTSHTGEPVSLSDFEGKVVVAYFGYSFCPDICPVHLTLLSAALDQLGRRTSLIQPLFISVDPERDTPEELNGYVRHFHENLIGLTGTIAEIDDVASSFAVAHEIVRQGEHEGYLVNHTSALYIINEQGKVVDLLRLDVTPTQLAAQIEQHL